LNRFSERSAGPIPSPSGLSAASEAPVATRSPEPVLELQLCLNGEVGEVVVDEDARVKLHALGRAARVTFTASRTAW
jgi:hypothetical protein